MQALKQKLITQIGVFAIYLILFIDNSQVTTDAAAITEAMNATIQAQTAADGTLNKPTLQQVGDSAFAPLETGATISGNANFIKWTAIAQGIFDSLEAGTGPVISFLKGIVAGHKAAKTA